MGKAQRFRGVRQRHWGSWVSEIRHPITKTRVWLGTFQSGEEAALAYDEAARFMCGAHAKTNYPYTYNNGRGYVLSPTLREKLRRCCYTMDQYSSTTRPLASPQGLLLPPSVITKNESRPIDLPIGSHYVSFSSWNNDLWKASSSTSSSSEDEEEDLTTTTNSSTNSITNNSSTNSASTTTTNASFSANTSTSSASLVDPCQTLAAYQEQLLMPPSLADPNRPQFGDDFVEEMIQELLNYTSFDLEFNLLDLPNPPSNLDYLAI